MTTRRVWAVGAALVTLAALGACGDSGSGGANTVRWYVFQEPSGAYDDAVKTCNEEAGGKYTVELVPLPTNADQQRELVVRRLAAEDTDIDIIGMDVIWTAEFAEAGWIREWTGQDADDVTQGTLAGPLRSGRYKDKLYAAPYTSNVQFLWYRKDRVKEAPKTWDELLDAAERLGPQDGRVVTMGARYEGLTVWFNTLISSAGGQVLDENGEPSLGAPAEEAAAVMSRLANSDVSDPNLSNAMEDPVRLAFQSGGPAFMLNWPFVYPSAKAEAPEVFKNMGVARYPSVKAGESSKVTLGGINLGVSAYSDNPDDAFAAAKCLRGAENQLIAAEKGGLPPTSEALYGDPKIKKAYPGFSDLMKESIDDGVPRPVSPAYSDVSLAIQQTLHPPGSGDPADVVKQLEDRIDVAAEGGLF